MQSPRFPVVEMKTQQEVHHFLKERLSSLLTNEPGEGTTPNVWVLDKEAPTFEEDRQFIKDHLPGHRVFLVRRHVSET